MINGGFWHIVAALAALSRAAFVAYKTGQDNGQCHR